MKTLLLNQDENDNISKIIKEEEINEQKKNK